jgi:hypothetical protein
MIIKKKRSNNSSFFLIKIYLIIFNHCLMRSIQLMIKNKNRVVSVDKICDNTYLINNGSLETFLNMGYYDFTNGIHVNIKFKGF